MVTITVDNSYSNITGLSPKQEKDLRDLLSYTVGGKAAFFSTYGPRKKSLLDKRGNFPTGLYHRVYKLLNNWELSVKIVDKRVVPCPKS